MNNGLSDSEREDLKAFRDFVRKGGLMVTDDVAILKKVVLIGNGAASLTERMRKVEGTAGTIKRLTWLLIGGVGS
jgi:CRISPR/Cas system-associated protein endoribonuclease Cas2